MKNRIDKIFRVLCGGCIYTRIELKKNYYFDFSGSQSEDCLSIRDVYETTKHIVYCNGE